MQAECYGTSALQEIYPYISKYMQKFSTMTPSSFQKQCANYIIHIFFHLLKIRNPTPCRSPPKRDHVLSISPRCFSVRILAILLQQTQIAPVHSADKGTTGPFYIRHTRILWTAIRHPHSDYACAIRQTRGSWTRPCPGSILRFALLWGRS